MISFDFTDVIAEGTAIIDMNTGKVTQACTVITTINGLVKGPVKLTDSVVFEIDAYSSIAGAWNNIKDTLAPAWVTHNYAESV